MDFVLGPEAIAERLMQIGVHPYLAPSTPSGDDGEEELDERFRRILAVVRQVMGVDFSLYRSTTIRRRIMRRMALHGHQDLSDYLEKLEKDVNEVDALYHDLLINVTSFFRDPEMFDVLKEAVFPEIVRGKPPSEPLRIWVPGCSTGQEAYSLAIALLEFHDSRPVRPTIQIFATDLSDQRALDKARAGVFPESIEAEVSTERLRRFFKREDHVYRIDKSIRDMCVFARQNVTADPPFSHLDLISCRNLLIYLSTPLQKRVMPTLHYALDVPGFLVLGAAESIGEHSDLFELVDRTHKISSKRPVPPRPLHFATEEYHVSIGTQRQAASVPPVDFQREADRILLGRFAPPAVLVNERFDIVQFRGRTSAYLEPPPGEPTTNVLKMAREGLLFELRSALTEARKTGKVVKGASVQMVAEHGSREIALEVLPVRPPREGSGCFLVVFHEAGARAKLAAEASAEARKEERAPGRRGGSTAAQRELQHLRQELVATKEYLQSLAEQQDAANEELRSANEEILSSNEELQSTNEELETAKEELQSSNEELTTVNEQLQNRNLELTEVNNDLTNLLSSTNIPLVMVGSDLCIRRFTGPAKRIMTLLPGDVGRPIRDIRAAVELADLEALVADVIERVQIGEREVRDREGRWYTLRVFPYRTADHKIDGAVIVLIDVDQIRRGKEELQEQAAMLKQQSALLELSHDAIIVRDARNRVTFWNRGAEEMYGYSAAEASGRPLAELLQTNPEAWAVLNATLDEIGSWEGELRQRRRDGREIIVQSSEVLTRDDDGKRFTVLSIKRDVTENKRVLKALKQADRRKDQFLATLAHELRNPIAPIQNAVEIMRLAGDDPATIDHVRDTIERQVRQLARIVEDLIDVSRIVERKIALRIERVSIDSVVNTAVETSRSLIESCGHEMIVELPAEPIYLDVDPVRLSQVVVNLLNNAAKFTVAGGRIWLTVEGQRKGKERRAGEAVIRVRDTGIGIPEDLKARIFEMFEQGGSLPEHGSSGLGVGLTLVRSLVHMHGGTVEVASEGPGRGSEFVVRLPAADPTTPLPRSENGDGEKGARRSRSPSKVLVVDDNRDQAQTLGKLLSLMGHEVRLAYDGEQALKEASDFLPDVALVDIGLPKINGFEIAKTMRKDRRFKNTILVAQTGWGQEHDRQRSKEAGFHHHLVKPAELSELSEILAHPADRGSS